MAGEPWAPTLSDVARHIPTRTRDTKTPGSTQLLGTFTANTTPTSEQAQAVIDTVVGVILADIGGTLPQPADEQVEVAARSAAEWRAAADIEIAYPNRDADVHLYDQLNTRANDELATLKRILVQMGDGVVDADPQWVFNRPPPWGDMSPGSGTDMIGLWPPWLP
ncbi:MAG TPA: hypothetical protein VNN79_09825 [Actinomycetota bacterium]|nr:hypothetical protein [Actinomycetota bacterium]